MSTGSSHSDRSPCGEEADAELRQNGALPLRLDALRELRVLDAGEVETYSDASECDMASVEKAVTVIARSGAVPVVLGDDEAVTLPDVTGVARHYGMGRISVIHFESAHAEDEDARHGHGPGPAARRLLESGAVRVDRFVRMGRRDRLPAPERPEPTAVQGGRSYGMGEIVTRGLDA
ncbi:arginase family protein, partial [Streptomyces sp. NPDC056437]|uniref:arginase family protein n=1 Tax=Streptomyces sp. NPDC056437 TaxID=3345816 RepID=UPI003694903B